MMRFWFAKGVDGFRMDALWYVLKDERFRDNPLNHRLLPLYTADLPEVHEVIADLRRVADAYDDRLLIGEILCRLSEPCTIKPEGRLRAECEE